MPGSGPKVNFESCRKYWWVMFFTDLRARLERLPGVTSVGAISLGPLEGVTTGLANVAVNGQPIGQDVDELMTAVGFVTPGYLQTMRMPLAGG